MDDRTVERGEGIQNYLESTAYRSTGLGLTRDTRATVDQVLDPKTIEVLQKMQKQALYDELAGCISTGKEANVYFGVKHDGSNVAVKVYKTSILGFRDRDEYVDGEFRFRHGYCKSNPRKMVSLWAEKEQRNLHRLNQAGINCPVVLRCKRNVLVMSLVGRPGKAAPRLKDVAHEPSVGWMGVYLDVVRSMRRMFQICKLVHGDLSEYNMLLDEDDRVFIIDVSQSVGVDHPRSLEFLKRDCLNINLFFSKKCDAVIPLQDLFYFVIDSNLSKGHGRDGLQLSKAEEVRMTQLLQSNSSTDLEIDDSVFLQTWVPSSLAEVGGIREVERLIDEKSRGIVTVFDSLMGTPIVQPYSDSWSSSASSSSSSSFTEEEADSLSDVASDADGAHDGRRPEGMSKQEWKRRVKEEKREQRKHKVPKHLKQKRNLKKYGKK